MSLILHFGCHSSRVIQATLTGGRPSAGSRCTFVASQPPLPCFTCNQQTQSNALWYLWHLASVLLMRTRCIMLRDHLELLLCRPRVVDMADHPQGLDLSREQALLVVCSTQVRLSLYPLFTPRVTAPLNVSSSNASHCLRQAGLPAGSGWRGRRLGMGRSLRAM